MIDRAPNMDAARAAADELAGELDSIDSARRSLEQEDAELGRQVVGDSTTSAASSPAASSPLGASRAQMIALGSMLVLNLSTAAAKRWGAQWVYTEAECEVVATAALDVAELYLDELDNPWWQLAIALGATAIPRLVGVKLPPLVESSTPAPSSTPPNGSAVHA